MASAVGQSTTTTSTTTPTTVTGRGPTPMMQHASGSGISQTTFDYEDAEAMRRSVSTATNTSTNGGGKVLKSWATDALTAATPATPTSPTHPPPPPTTTTTTTTRYPAHYPTARERIVEIGMNIISLVNVNDKDLNFTINVMLNVRFDPTPESKEAYDRGEPFVPWLQVLNCERFERLENPACAPLERDALMEHVRRGVDGPDNKAKPYLYLVNAILTLSTPFNLREYPFDVQHLQCIFVSNATSQSFITHKVIKCNNEYDATQEWELVPALSAGARRRRQSRRHSRRNPVPSACGAWCASKRNPLRECGCRDADAGAGAGADTDASTGTAPHYTDESDVDDEEEDTVLLTAGSCALEEEVLAAMRDDAPRGGSQSRLLGKLERKVKGRCLAFWMAWTYPVRSFLRMLRGTARSAWNSAESFHLATLLWRNQQYAVEAAPLAQLWNASVVRPVSTAEYAFRRRAAVKTTTTPSLTLEASKAATTTRNPSLTTTFQPGAIIYRFVQQHPDASSVGQSYQRLEIILAVRRRSRAVLYTLLLPTWVLSFSSLSIFALGSTNSFGERLSTAYTVVLSIIATFLAVKDRLPFIANFTVLDRWLLLLVGFVYLEILFTSILPTVACGPGVGRDPVTYDCYAANGSASVVPTFHDIDDVDGRFTLAAGVIFLAISVWIAFSGRSHDAKRKRAMAVVRKQAAVCKVVETVRRVEHELKWERSRETGVPVELGGAAMSKSAEERDKMRMELKEWLLRDLFRGDPQERVWTWNRLHNKLAEWRAGAVDLDKSMPAVWDGLSEVGLVVSGNLRMEDEGPFASSSSTTTPMPTTPPPRPQTSESNVSGVTSVTRQDVVDASATRKKGKLLNATGLVCSRGAKEVMQHRALAMLRTRDGANASSVSTTKPEPTPDEATCHVRVASLTSSCAVRMLTVEQICDIVEREAAAFMDLRCKDMFALHLAAAGVCNG